MKSDDELFDDGNYVDRNARKIVLDSLAENHFQTIRHLHLNTGLSLDEISFVVELDKLIGYTLVGFLTVYFLNRNAPTGRLYNTGNNGFKLVDGSLIQPSSPSARPRRSKQNVQAKLNLLEIEKCGYLGLSVKKMADHLGVSFASLSFYIYSKDYPKYGEAFRRGKERCANEKGTAEAVNI